MVSIDSLNLFAGGDSEVQLAPDGHGYRFTVLCDPSKPVMMFVCLDWRKASRMQKMFATKGCVVHIHSIPFEPEEDEVYSLSSSVR